MSHPGEPINRVRRRDRAVEDDAWIRAFLQQARYGVVATECDGQPFMNPVVFAYDQETHAIYFHTGRAGRIFANISRNPRVCFNASRMGAVIPAATSAGCDVEYESVVVFGKAEVLSDAAEATHALRLLLEKYDPERKYGVDYQPITPEQLARTAAYRVRVEAWSGKRNPNEP
jgi:nitroimidazol reductase NimA-like FMN-containing flavoprotein (pyridoxamine 5'-phosphate oxidase superfamily)